MLHKMMRREIKLFDILEDMRKAFPAYADALGKEFDDDTVIVRKAGPAETVDVQPGEHVIVGRISTIAVDTYQEVVLPEGMNKSSYEKNPVVLFGHNYLDFLPHGENVWLTPYPRKKPHEVRAATKYYQDQERGRDIYSHREQKRPLGYSIGYIPLKDITPADDDWKETLEMWQDRYAEYKGGNVTKKSIPKPRLITKDWILLEYSDVVVPANPDAVQIYVEKGFITPDEIPEYTLGMVEDPVDQWVDFNPMKPYPNEHACRVNDPGKYDRLRRNNCKIEHDGKCIDVIFGIKEGKSEIQAYRFKKDVWSADAARSWCSDHDGSFEAAASEASADDFDLVKILDEIEHDDIDEDFDLDPREIAGLVVGSIKDIFKPSGKSSKAGDPPLADDDFNLDELPTPEELLQLKKGKVL